jgi:DNA polymerase II large subunit
MAIKDRRKQDDKRYRNKLKCKKQYFYSKVGTECIICGSEKRLVCHRKSFEKHISIANLSSQKLLQENVNDYARLCYRCHFGVHWVHDMFKISWKEIILQLDNLIQAP